jgi:hypothetical protein
MNNHTNSGGPPFNNLPLVSEEEYHANQRQIRELEAYVGQWKEMNELRHQVTNQLRRKAEEELLQKVQEGERARRLLEQIQNPRSTQFQIESGSSSSSIPTTYSSNMQNQTFYTRSGVYEPQPHIQTARIEEVASPIVRFR